MKVPQSIEYIVEKADRFAIAVGVPQYISRALFIKYYHLDREEDADVFHFVNRYRRFMKEVHVA